MAEKRFVKGMVLKLGLASESPGKVAEAVVLEEDPVV